VQAYYAEKRLRIYNGDAVEILDMLPGGCIDLVFADPPYNRSNGGFTCHAGKRVSVNKGKWDKSRGVEEDFEFHYNWIQACRRVLKPNGSLWISGTYHSIYACGFALQKQGWHTVNDICWFKPNAAPNLACRMFTASHETLIWARKSKAAKHYFNYNLVRYRDWNGDFITKPNRQMRSVWTINTPRNGEKKHGRHPTQKPESLLERIILACTPKNALILDPFCGSATTGVVALRNNRRFVGIDSSEEYLKKLAIPRIQDLREDHDPLWKKPSPADRVRESRKEYGLLPAVRS